MDKKIINAEELKHIQLEMLSDIADFCEQNQIKYFLAYGTLIGAIRHKGYIPWDDDIDICMPRPDYEKFLSLYNKKKSDYKVVAFELDDTYKLPFAKVNDTRTVMWETMYDQDVFGVYIDVFPIDGCDKDGNVICQNTKLGQYLNAKKAILGKGRSFKKNCIIAMGKCLLAFTSVKTLLKKMQKMSTIVSYDKAEYVANIMYSYGKNEIMKKSDLGETIFGEFEGRQYRIPKEYHKYLTQIYGDYMQLPPKEKRMSTHTFKAWWK